MAKSLIVVESPAKARTLQKYLGSDFLVKASVGHIRDLPVNDLGVDIESGFTPKYVTIRGKGKVISDLKTAAKNAADIYLAPDPDREGEAIAHHIAHILKGSKKPVHRALFHEITKKAIFDAIANAGELNEHLFEAQQVRRILDRLVGYQISPLLWKKVRRGLSAGRVQSVAVRMVCERDEEIRQFEPIEYWSIETELEGAGPPPFIARVDRAGKIKLGKGKIRVAESGEAHSLAAELEGEKFIVEQVDKKSQKRNPPPPFITSTMQIDANRKLRFSAKRTMTLAQRLYEGIEVGSEGPVGLITYMRTDSTRINGDALAQARKFIKASMGANFLPAKPRVFKTSKAAQDAHEAIRPTDVTLTPERLAPFLDKGLLALYTLIWKRFVASQMAAAQFDKTSVKITAGRFALKANGSVMKFPGFLSLYEAAEVIDSGAKKGDAILPPLKPGDDLKCLKVSPNQHFTQPPPAYTEASLVKALEENGVGRPSTYATIISTIQDKGYVEMNERKFNATDLGRLVNELLVEHFPDVVNVDFTASMEKKLDKVEEGEADWQALLSDFYTPFSRALAAARENMKNIKKLAIPAGVDCDLCGGGMVIKWGKNGEFLACEKYPECTNTMDFERDGEGKIIPKPRPQPEESDETCDKCGKPMVYKHGRYGRFLACSGYPQCRNIKAETTGVNCPEEGCDGELVRKVSKRGKVFYSCNRYPKCTFAIWDKPIPEKCPKCGYPFLVSKEKKDGSTTVRCPEKGCKYKA